MQVYYQHDWDVNTLEARKLQEELAGRIVRSGNPGNIRLVAGIDVSVNRFSRRGTAAVVVLRHPELTVVETVVIGGEIRFPYVPGLLTFREAPLILAACEELTASPDLILVDGQGIAHPRRMGLAAHLGLFLERPTIGVAKSRLCGDYMMPDEVRGSVMELTDDGEVIGMVVRTKNGVKPLFISTGHKIGLDDAVAWTLACCRGFRLPEPTRQAHMAAKRSLKTVDECGTME